MSEANLILLGICAITTIVLLIWFISTSGSNTRCYNCDAKLPFGQTKNHVVKLKDGGYQNICSRCDKRLYNRQKKRKDKHR
ncbi:hypothetical protein MRN18_16380 [bacterium 19MO04SH03]|uniref:Uncharacterized protein n=3 Tax=Unclassified Bacteria TaxID=49928 RepID=A0AAU6TP74_UNCXX